MEVSLITSFSAFGFSIHFLGVFFLCVDDCFSFESGLDLEDILLVFLKMHLKIWLDYVKLVKLTYTNSC